KDLLTTTTSTLTTLLNTVAPPISAHETLELWLTHPMIGYSGVEGVVYRAWMHVLEQTESGELIVIWSPSSGDADEQNRGIYPVEGYEKGWETVEAEMKALREREEKDPRGRRAHQAKANPDVPVTTIPIFLHLLPVLAPLSIPEPPLLLSAPSTASESASKPNHLSFILTLQDPSHSLRFTTITQTVPADWLEVEYDRSDWVEERLVDVIKTGVEVIAQDYVSTRMGLKPSAVTRAQTPVEEVFDAAKEGAEEVTEEKTVA
ncbi:hypothetical protein P7C73_g5605, partial [Tremellales sp. Uapishka_1]